MNRLNIIMFVLVLVSICNVFAKDSYESQLSQVESILVIEDLLCIDDCDQTVLINEAVSLNKAITRNAK
jgi:hypothetical protein